MAISTRHYLDNVLSFIGQEGFSGLKVEASSLLSALSKLDHPSDSSLSLRKRIVHELHRQKLVETTLEGTVLRIQLSIKGMYRVQKKIIDRLTIPQPAHWDGQWRIVMFDIPARHSQSRYILTAQLRRLGFIMIQSSTWVHPYPCREICEQIINFANLQGFVSYGTLSEVDPVTERILKRHFSSLLS